MIAFLILYCWNMKYTTIISKLLVESYNGSTLNNCNEQDIARPAGLSVRSILGNVQQMVLVDRICTFGSCVLSKSLPTKFIWWNITRISSRLFKIIRSSNLKIIWSYIFPWVWDFAFCEDFTLSSEMFFITQTPNHLLW